MRVCLYTSGHLLDSAIETIQAIKNDVELHVFVEISPYSKSATLLNIDKIDQLDFLENPENALGSDQWRLFKPYFDGLKSMQFVVYKSRKSLTIPNFIKSYRLGKKIRKLKPDVIHIDNISHNALGLYSCIKGENAVISIHDPVSHSGEKSFKQNFFNRIFSGIAKSYLFYSEYSASIFKKNNEHSSVPVYHTQLQPYTFFTNFSKRYPEYEGYVAFVGRLSLYKGIDILLDAIPLVLKKYPEQKFIIAGSPSYGYHIDESLVKKHEKNITLISKYMKTEEISGIIKASKFVVCPYRDATQSGVLMTANALGKTAITSNVGSFNEYVIDNTNGYLCAPDPESLANKIIEALDNDRYKSLEASVVRKSNAEQQKNISKQVINAYLHH